MPKTLPDYTIRLIEFGQSRFGKKHGWKTKFAAALGMNRQGLNPYFAGVKPGNILQDRLRELKCDMEWLLTGKKSEEKEVGETIPLMNVPVYAHVNAGEKKWVVSEDIVDYIAIPKSSDSTLFGLIVKGDSMYDEISDGDIIIISGKVEVKSGDLCVVEWMDGDRHLRRVTFDKNNIVLASKNNELFPPIITHKSKIRKLYRVMKHIRNY
jgi:SOS-response transcriptional repressor LexA